MVSSFVIFRLALIAGVKAVVLPSVSPNIQSISKLLTLSVISAEKAQSISVLTFTVFPLLSLVTPYFKVLSPKVLYLNKSSSPVSGISLSKTSCTDLPFSIRILPFTSTPSATYSSSDTFVITVLSSITLVGVPLAKSSLILSPRLYLLNLICKSVKDSASNLTPSSSVLYSFVSLSKMYSCSPMVILPFLRRVSRFASNV